VVHGHGGLDELTTSGPNRVSHLQDGQVRTYALDPADLGLRPARRKTCGRRPGGERQKMLRALLCGRRWRRSARRDVVLLNSAAALACVVTFTGPDC
jgi:anthranilate phosphoribosyltransferase